MTKANLKYYAPVLFFFFLLLDGQLTSFLDGYTHNVYFAISHFLLLAFLLATDVLPKRYLIVTALILGLIYDSYYVGIIGIYSVIYPLTVALMITFEKTINTNVFTRFFGAIISITFFELAALVMQMLFQFTNAAPLYFISRALGPTLLLNICLYWIFVYPLGKLFFIWRPRKRPAKQ
ncbi:rod shape-determining protein MreD [Enterococcus canis]|uniref:Rod shape-determining protein MreD n=1 Tax=Enterococcus canis TaxID=214095 RepID=A0A1L8RGC0_9ENTE|nr:rod shape-determining protein MreD [Enterococcus canis]OJG18784.1 rod shape-determining protein MreD [Enterococcus canis]